MIDKEWLPVLVCPTDNTPLSIADEQVVARVNRAIAAGRVKNRAGRIVGRPIEGGLLRADKTYLYPILSDIPVLLADEAIQMAQIR
jgi:uncharacterized protein YbaR (Trm112 family)